ncbi:MAG TPA: SRPBCC family protein [Steroidobacteraceae bacterium]|jgi:uncharacterized protein YndB with AHSA1/START domain|nr:SRPBCC family protein [Steroidobacteraceae bacterium]
MQDRIEKQVELKAPLARVWRALTDYQQFGSWFGVRLEQPFVPGQASVGNITYQGYEHLRMRIEIKTMEPEKLFSFHWHPYAIDARVDYSQETPTLVEFHLRELPGGGTLLRVIESGFAQLPPHRYADALRMNDSGWSQQMANIARYVARES